MSLSTLRLGYIGFRGDPAEWIRFASDVFGLQAIETDDGVRFRLDERMWRISVEAGEASPDPVFIGLEYDSHPALDEVVGRLRAAGYQAVEDRELAQVRNVGRLIRTSSPDGVNIELFMGALTLSTPFASPTGARFVTGEAGLGHVLLLVPDMEQALHFYETILGLNRSDVVEMGPGIDAHFLNGGHRHHVVALASLPGLAGFDHLFVEVDHLATVGLAWDKVLAGAAPVARSIGQHANDPALSFYVQSPSGNLFEYGYGSKIIENPERWVQTRWESAYLWGGQFGSHSVR